MFVGRQRELGELKAALDDAMAGHGRLVMLAGEPGIGKTRTAQELASHAETLGVQVLWGRCYEEEGTPPYWPWLQLLRSYMQQHTPEQLQGEMGSGAADIAEIVSKVREKLPNLEAPPALEPEQAVLDYLGQFSDPELVKKHLAIGQAKELEQKEVELEGVSRAWLTWKVSSSSTWTY